MVTVLMVGIITYIVIYVGVRICGTILVDTVKVLALLLDLIAQVSERARHRRIIRRMGIYAVANELHRYREPVVLIDRGDGVYAPSRGEW